MALSLEPHRMITRILAWLGSGFLCISAISAPPLPAVPADTRPSLELELPSPGPVDVTQAPAAAKSLLKSLVQELLPEEYVDERKWGGTRERWDGLKVRVEGLEIHTKRRWKEVNHGTWKKYRISLVDPDEYLQIQIAQTKRLGPGKFACDVHIASRLDLYGRVQEWNNGVRLVSISAAATADVTIDLSLEVTTSIDPTKFPPDVIVEPHIRDAKVRLSQLKLHRISKASGPIVRELGDALEKVARRELAERNEKLVLKMNQQIDKKKDELRFSLSDLVKHKWLGIQPQENRPAADQDAAAEPAPP